MVCRYLETGKANTEGVRTEVTAHTKDGRPLIIELLLNSATDPTGNTTFVVVLHDITST